MLPWLLLVGSICTALAGFGGYAGGRADGVELERGRHATEAQLVAKVAEQAALGTAAEIARIQVTQTTIRQRVETEIREKPVYRDCVHDQRVFDALNAALVGAESVGGGELPSADPAARSEHGRDNAEAVRHGPSVPAVSGGGAAGARP